MYSLGIVMKCWRDENLFDSILKSFLDFVTVVFRGMGAYINTIDHVEVDVRTYD